MPFTAPWPVASEVACTFHKDSFTSELPALDSVAIFTDTEPILSKTLSAVFVINIAVPHTNTTASTPNQYFSIRSKDNLSFGVYIAQEDIIS